MSEHRRKKSVPRSPGRPAMESEPRKGVEVSLTAADIEYARDLTGGNLSAALTMLIREHKRSRDTLVEFAEDPPEFTQGGTMRKHTPEAYRKRVQSIDRAIDRLEKQLKRHLDDE